eukprot:56074-Eustigmatos_ZCMA.PRE.1
MPPMMSTTAFGWVFPRPAAAYINEWHRQGAMISWESLASGMTDAGADLDPRDDAVHGIQPDGPSAGAPEGPMQQEIDDVFAAQGTGTALSYRVPGGHIPVPSHVHYAHRGRALRKMCLYTYAAVVSIVEA